VRSFSYAAYSGLNQFLSSHADAVSETDRLTAWARYWQNAASEEFVHAYRTAMGANSNLFPEPGQAQALFSAYLLEKALYELLYELNNRPAWLRIPIGGILSM
jgi:maltose alpha-D-glucosyltransferase / alpha-amylase